MSHLLHLLSGNFDREELAEGQRQRPHLAWPTPEALQTGKRLSSVSPCAGNLTRPNQFIGLNGLILVLKIRMDNQSCRHS